MENCICCRGPLHWGKFAYKQSICWECFKEKCLEILEQHIGEEREILVHIMSAYAEYFREKF